MPQTPGTITSRTAFDWRALAACSGHSELFLPSVEHGGYDPAAAKRICADCPVRQECLEWALETEEPCGVWGGLDERERRNLVDPAEDDTMVSVFDLLPPFGVDSGWALVFDDDGGMVFDD